MRNLESTATAALWLTLTALGCVGQIADTGPVVDPPPPHRPGVVDPDDVLPPRLVRLSAAQLENVLGDLLTRHGADAAILDDLRFPFAGDAGASRYSTDASVRAVSDLDFEALYDLTGVVADATAAAILGDGESCLAHGESSEVCFAEVLRADGERILRAPLAADHVAEYATTAFETAALTEPVEALAIALQAMLLSPYAMYRLELGEDDGASGVVPLTPYERAAMLSFALLDGGTDEALLAAAADGSLADEAAVEEHASRLIATARAQSAILRFFREYLDYENYTATNDPEQFPELDFATSVTDTDRLIEHLLQEHETGFLVELFTTDVAFVSPSTAGFHGLDAATIADDGELVTFEGGQRHGILTQPSWLARFATFEHTDPVARGLFIREQILCGEVPEIPIDFIPEIPEGDDLTMRERLAMHRQEPCAGCHLLMDPIGLALEHFDLAGRYRTEEVGRPVDATGEVLQAEDATGPVADHVEMMERFAASEHVRDCFLAQAYQHWLGTAARPSVGSTLTAESRDAYAESEGSYARSLAALLASHAATHRRRN